MRSDIILKGKGRDLVIIGLSAVIVATTTFSIGKITKLEDDFLNSQEKIEKIEESYSKYLQDSSLEIENLKKENSKKEILIKDQNSKIEILKKEILNKEVVSKPSRGENTRVFEATAYCPCEICNGKWVGYPTASGTNMVAGRTIAVDPNVIPLGSTVRVNGHDYIAEDTGSSIKGNIIDIFHSTHSEATSFGRQKVNVEVIK